MNNPTAFALPVADNLSPRRSAADAEWSAESFGDVSDCGFHNFVFLVSNDYTICSKGTCCETYVAGHARVSEYSVAYPENDDSSQIEFARLRLGREY